MFLLTLLLRTDAVAADMAGEQGLSPEVGKEAVDAELDQLLNQDLSSLRRTSVTPDLDVEVSTVSRQQSTVRTIASSSVRD